MKALAKAWAPCEKSLLDKKTPHLVIDSFRNIFYCGASSVFQTMFAAGRTKAQTEEALESLLTELEEYSAELKTRADSAQAANP